MGVGVGVGVGTCACSLSGWFAYELGDVADCDSAC